MSAHGFQKGDRVYVSYATPWSGRMGTVARDEADSLGRVRVLLDGDDDGTGQNWVAIEAEYLIPSFDVEDVLGDEPEPEPTPPRQINATHAALAIAAALIFGTASGAWVAATPTIQAPHECTVMANLADKIFIAQENATEVTHLRATRGQSEYADHDAELNRLWGEIDAAHVEYIDAENACLGDGR